MSVTVMAKEQVYAFIAIIAIVFRRFKLELAEGANTDFPKLDETTLSTGIIGL